MTKPALRYWATLLWLVASSAFAQVYTWTDSNGRTHYSDQPNSNDASLTTIDIGAMPAPKIVPTATPRLLEGPLHALIVGQFGYGPDVLNAPEPVARFYVGADCVSPQELSFKQLRESFAKVIRTHEQLQVDVFRAIRKLGHTRLFRSGHYRDNAKDKHSKRYLSAQVNQLTLSACNPQGQPSTDVATLSERQIKRFKQVNVWLQVHWQLHQRSTAEPLLSITTQGSAATQIDTNVNLLNAARRSFLAATDNALNHPELRSALTASEVP